MQAPRVAAPAGTVHRETGTVTLRTFVDRSILEVYRGGAALTDRLYPDASATGVDLFAEGELAHTPAPSPRGRCAAPGNRGSLFEELQKRRASSAMKGEPIGP